MDTHGNLPSEFASQNIKVESTNYFRTLQSAYAQMWGMFPQNMVKNFKISINQYIAFKNLKELSIKK